nr:zinc-binding dehydrogenase [Pedobacter sp. ASV2]
MKNDNQALAMVFSETGKAFAKESVVLSPPSTGEILVNILYTTICASDLHTYNGRRSTPSPCILGHEIIGRIVTFGDQPPKDERGTTLKIGDLVTWCIYAFDPNNELARNGIPQKSPNLYKYGHHQFGVNDSLNGGFATHCLLKEGTAIFKLPENIDLKILAPLNCTHATMAGALRVAGNISNKNVLITGLGMLGLSACALANEAGAKKVLGMDVNPKRILFAKEFGVKQFLDADLTVAELQAQLEIEDKIDIVIDTTGLPAVMEKGLELLNIGGTAVWIGAVYSQPKTAVNAEMIIRNVLTIKGLHNYTPSDLAVAVDFIEKNHLKYPFASLVGTDFELNDLDEAFEIASKGQHYRVGVKQ